LKSDITGKHLDYAARASRKLARTIFHALLRHGPKLEREQLLLGRLVDIGTELFAITAACSRAEELLQQNKKADEDKHLTGLLDFFCRQAQSRIGQKFARIHHNDDRASHRLAQQIMAGQLDDLTHGIVRSQS
ncbi:MAG: DNA polymerase II, partial [Verrucomicrobiota bacterium]